MKTFTKTAGFTFIEMVISIAIFAQITVLVGTVIISALELNSTSKANKTVNLELYSIMTNGIGSYIRKSTGIMYPNHPSKIKYGTTLHEKDGIKTQSLSTSAFTRTCNESDQVEFDQLTLFLDKNQENFITFAVQKNTGEGTSRIVWRKGSTQSELKKEINQNSELANNEAWRFLNSKASYISCFWVSVSPDPYAPTSIDSDKDIQPYVQISLAGRYLYADISDENDLNFFTQNTYTSYQSTFTLRNYSY